MMTEDQRRLKRMLVSAINAREVEFTRVSRLLHDEVGQVLSAVGLQLDVLKLDYRAQLPEIAGRTKEIQDLLERAVVQVRALSYDLNPAVVEKAGLESALDRLVGRFRAGFGGKIRLHYDPAFRPPLEVGNAWYRIAELALDNAVQHAQAGRIEVEVRASKKLATLEVRDDGKGFSRDDANVQTPGLGLLLMEHYASQAPVEVVFESAPGAGTVVRTTWKVADRSKTGGDV